MLRKKEGPFQSAKKVFPHLQIFKELPIKSNVVTTAGNPFG